MKKIILFILLSPVFCNGQNNLQRTVLHTLGKNQILYSNEYIVSQATSKNKFALIAEDTLTKVYSFIYNGEKIYSGDWLHILDVDLTTENGYLYQYREDDKWFVNYHGKVEGPYEKVEHEKFNMYEFNIDDLPQKFDYFYQLGSKWYSFNDGSREILQKKKKTQNRKNSFVGFTKITWDGNITYSLNGIDVILPEKFDEWSSGNEFGPKASFGDDLAFFYTVNNNVYFSLYNGSKIDGPFDNKTGNENVSLDNGHYIYSYSKDGQFYVNIDGKRNRINGDKIRGGSLDIFDNGNYYFRYSNNDDKFININGTTYGPFDKYIYNGTSIKKNNFAFIYQLDGLYYININGNNSKGCLSIFNLEYYENGKYKYLFTNEDGWVYENNNGTISKTDDKKIHTWSATPLGKRPFGSESTEIIIKSKDKKHQLISSWEYDYVVVDGKMCGKSPAIRAWFDDRTNSFVWNSWENKELVLYELKIN